MGDIETIPEFNLQSAVVKMMESSNIDMDKFEQFINLQITLQDRQSNKALNKALTVFQMDCPIITKTKKGHNSSYAPFDQIVYEIKPLLKKCGLSYSFETKKINDNETEMIVTIRHEEGGHFNSAYTYLSLDDGGKMNSSQKKRSANSYAKRTALENALGIATQGEDDDAKRAVETKITADKLEEIKTLMKNTKTDEKKMLVFLKVDSFEDLSEFEAKKALHALRQKRSS